VVGVVAIVVIVVMDGVGGRFRNRGPLWGELGDFGGEREKTPSLPVDRHVDSLCSTKRSNLFSPKVASLFFTCVSQSRNCLPIPTR